MKQWVISDWETSKNWKIHQAVLSVSLNSLCIFGAITWSVGLSVDLDHQFSWIFKSSKFIAFKLIMFKNVSTNSNDKSFEKKIYET